MNHLKKSFFIVMALIGVNTHCGPDFRHRQGKNLFTHVLGVYAGVFLVSKELGHDQNHAYSLKQKAHRLRSLGAIVLGAGLIYFNGYWLLRDIEHFI